MTSTKTLIAEAVSRYPLQDTPAWRDFATRDGAELDHIETDARSITCTDCLFDGEATIVLKGARALQAMIFGRFDSRRAEVERIVFHG